MGARWNIIVAHAHNVYLKNEQQIFGVRSSYIGTSVYAVAPQITLNELLDVYSVYLRLFVSFFVFFFLCCVCFFPSFLMYVRKKMSVPYKCYGCILWTLSSILGLFFFFIRFAPIEYYIYVGRSSLFNHSFYSYEKLKKYKAVLHLRHRIIPSWAMHSGLLSKIDW